MAALTVCGPKKSLLSQVDERMQQNKQMTLQKIRSEAFEDIEKFEYRNGGRVSDMGMIREHQGKPVYDGSSVEQKIKD